MKPSVVYLKNIETIGIRCGELIKESLIALGIDMGKLQKKRLSRCRFDRTIEPECFEQPLPLPNRFDPTRSDQSSDQGMQFKAALILGKVANRPFNLLSSAVILAQ